MNWEAFHHRGDVLHAVITEVDNRRDGILPMDLPGVDETFRDELDLLSALALRWHTRLAGRFERELFLEPMELEDSVIATWRGTVEELPGIRAVLDHYAPGAWSLFESNDQLEAFGEAWREASGIGLGESSASSNSFV